MRRGRGGLGERRLPREEEKAFAFRMDLDLNLDLDLLAIDDAHLQTLLLLARELHDGIGEQVGV